MQQSKADKLHQDIRHEILTLALPPGCPLRLPALSKRYGVGLTPIRECLNRLSTENYVVPEHNKGFQVAALSSSELLDLERARSVIEGSLFVQATEQGDESWEADIVGSFHQLSKTAHPSALDSSEVLQLWSQRHARFHSALIGASRSTWLHRFCEQLTAQLSRYHLFIQIGLHELTQTHPDQGSAAASVFSRAMALEPHRELFDVAIARDSHAARDIFTQHSNLSIAAFEELVQMLPADNTVARTLHEVNA